MNLLPRIKKLEALRPAPLMVVCRLPNDEVANLTVDECIAAGADPIRTSGNNLDDAKRLLVYIGGPDCAIK